MTATRSTDEPQSTLAPSTSASDVAGHLSAASPTAAGAHGVRDAHLLPVADVARALSVDPARGLDGAEVARRIAVIGPNRLAEPVRRAAWRRFLDQFRSLLILILLAAAVLAGLIGDVKEIEAIRKVFGDKAPPISATKSLTGHSLGAAGAHEAIYSLLMMNNGDRKSVV